MAPLRISLAIKLQNHPTRRVAYAMRLRLFRGVTPKPNIIIDWLASKDRRTLILGACCVIIRV